MNQTYSGSLKSLKSGAAVRGLFLALLGYTPPPVIASFPRSDVFPGEICGLPGLVWGNLSNCVNLRLDYWNCLIFFTGALD